jgi:hypothetical protein
MLYGADTWRITENYKKKILAVEMEALKRVARTSRLERIRNERIREIVGREKTVMEEIESYQLK